LGLVPFWTPALVEAGGSLPSERLDFVPCIACTGALVAREVQMSLYFGGMASSEKGSRLDKPWFVPFAHVPSFTRLWSCRADRGLWLGD